jgi:hypothetical protein
MHDVSKIPAPQWANYKAKCEELIPELVKLRDLFADIAGGKYDAESAFMEVSVRTLLDGFRDELKYSLDPDYQPFYEVF